MDTTTKNAFEVDDSDQRGHDAPTVQDSFHICDEKSANWFLRQIANNASEKVRVTAQAATICADLDADTARLHYLFGESLEHYIRERLAADGNRRRSVKFLQGVCAFRYQSPAVRLKDTNAALIWCKENAPLLLACELVERVDTEAFRQEAERVWSATGELLPGVEYSEGGDVFSLSFPSAVKLKKRKE